MHIEEITQRAKKITPWAIHNYNRGINWWDKRAVPGIIKTADTVAFGILVFATSCGITELSFGLTEQVRPVDSAYSLRPSNLIVQALFCKSDIDINIQTGQPNLNATLFMRNPNPKPIDIGPFRIEVRDAKCR